MVARTLVSQNHQDEMPSVAERARYCQLMAAKLKLDPVQASRLILSAWLSALEDNHEMIKPLVALHQLEDILSPSEDTVPEAIEALILNLVRAFQALKKESDSIAHDPSVAQKFLMKAWATSANEQSMVRKFTRVLQDESFLSSSTASAAGSILLVDPEEAVTPLLSIPLSNHGYNVTVASDVATAKTIIADTAPNLIISEMEMPLVDGLEFCKNVKTGSTTSDIPFIIITSKKGHKIPTKCLKAGAEDYLTKPVDLELLFLKVERFVDIPEEKAEQASEPETGVIGSLKDMKFTDMIQIFCAGGKSMKITLTENDIQGCVFIQDGNIIAAEAGDLSGDQAFYQLMRWSEGCFSTSACSEFPEATIQSSIMSLMMEGARLADEGIAPE